MTQRLRTVVFSLIPVAILLAILEIAGRIVYPFDADSRAMVIAKRDPRTRLPYFHGEAGKPDGRAIMWDVNRMEKRYLPFLGYLGKPGTTLPTIATNELGFRDRAIAPRQPHEFRILVLGGSTAWSLGASSNEHTVSAALERRLNKDGGKVRYRVMNGAFPSYIARQEMIVLTVLLREFDPDLVVSLTGYNDLVTVINETSDILERPEEKKLADAVDTNLRPMDTAQALRKVTGSLGVWRLVVYFRELKEAASPTTGEYRYDAGKSVKWMPRIADIHRMMARFASDHGHRYVIALQPDLETTGKTMPPEEAALRAAELKRNRGFAETWRTYRQDLASALGGLDGVPVVDLKGAFDGLAEPLFIDGCHLTDRGYDHLAAALATALTPWLPPAAAWPQ